MVMRLFVPSELIDQYGPITLSGSADGEEMPPLVLNEPGNHVFTGRLKTGRSSQVITFTLDKALPSDAGDPRERGVIVASIDCE